jgi:hypothetical protein
MYPLSAEVIREAYFFGRSSNRGKVAEFLGQYTRVFPPQDGNSFVGRIELRTPYQQIVQRSWENQVDYSEQQAQIDSSGEQDVIGVRVFLHLAGTRPAPSDLYSDGNGRVLDHRENFWREFQFRVTQEHELQPKKIVGRPLYGRRGQGLTGAVVELEFDRNEFASREMLIVVIAPQARTIAATFPLDRLK